MAQDRILPYGSPLPASWLAGLQEYVGVATHNFHLSLANATTVQVVAGALSDQVAIGIDGLFRYISSTVTSAITGTAGLYDVFAVCGPNSFTNIPTVDTDLTVYAFALQVLAHGTTPTITGTVTNFRKVGEVDWDGSKVTGFRQLQGEFTAVGNISATAAAAAVRPIRAIGVSGQTAALQTWESASAVLATLSATGGLALSDALAGTTGVFTGSLSPGSLAVTGSATVGGTLGVSSGATIGGTLGVTGAATLSGGAAITGTLSVSGLASLPGGSTTLTRALNDNTLNVATTEFVARALAGLVTGSKLTYQIHAFTTSDQTSPDSAVTILGSFPVYPALSETVTLIGAIIHCTTQGGTPSVFKVMYDHAAHGTLALVTSLGSLTPNSGAEVFVAANAGTPLALASLDRIAVQQVTTGNSFGCSIAVVTGHLI